MAEVLVVPLAGFARIVTIMRGYVASSVPATALRVRWCDECGGAKERLKERGRRWQDVRAVTVACVA